MLEIPQFIVDRVRAGAGVFAADEISTWRPGLLDELVASGVLRADQPTRSVACDACGDDHVEEVHYIESPPGTGLRAYIPCPQLGRVHVPLDRLRQWRVDDHHAAVAALLTCAEDDDAPEITRHWPAPEEHTTGKLWTRQDGVLCLSTKTDGVHDGEVEFAPTASGELTYQMRFMQVMCFKFPGTATLAEVIEQVYPDEYAEASRDPATLAKTLRKLRSLVSDVRTKKLAKAGLNPDILPPLSVEASIDTGIGLRLAKLHRLDDKELDDADAAPG